MRKIITIAILFLALNAQAQRHEIINKNIASLQVMAGDNWQGMPITTLKGEPINIKFDELSHEYHRYTYKIQHCQADWTPSENLFESDFIDGFTDDNTIDNYQESLDTYQLYTHYSLQIPNDRCRLKMSGNYKLTVLDDNNEDEPVLSVCFMISEESASMSLGFTTNTDIDINGEHQQLIMQANYPRLNVTSPNEQLYTVVLQNQQWANAVINPKAQFKMQDGMRWEHCKDLIFPAGNEYHKFETLDPTHTTMGLESVGWDEIKSQWHAYVFPDIPSLNYSYDIDANGSFLIRNSDNYENNITCDYIQTHFELHAPRQDNPIYLNGVWTNGQLLPEYEMKWNYDKNVYETVVDLKQGYYSYRYITLDTDGRIERLPSEGNFFETENTYQALLYYRGTGDRTDRLVSFTEITTGKK